MLTVEQALARMLERADPVDVEVVPTLEADGRVLATDVVSTLDVPPLDNSQMDGYAVRTVDVPAAGHDAARQPAHRCGTCGRRARAGDGGAHLHRRAVAGGRRCRRDAGGVHGARVSA